MVEARVGQPAIEAFGDVEGAPGRGGHPGDHGDSGGDDSFDRPDEAAKEAEVGEDVGEGLEIVEGAVHRVTANITINAIQGTDLTVSGVPSGAVNAGAPVSFQVSFSKAVTPPATYYGLVFVGPAVAPTAIQIPVTVHFVPTVSTIYLPLVMKNAP